MNDLSSALALSVQACQAQQWPTHCLFMVATPIGNLGDVTVRALQALALADTIACEDTRHSQSLLRALGLEKPASCWLAVHEHNEQQAAEEVIVRLQSGQRVVYLCDAGTPGLSDPGARLVAAVQAKGLRASPVPGASSVTALLSVSGDVQRSDWVFTGFLPAKGQAREAAMQAIAADARAHVLLESPHRMDSLAELVQVLGDRTLTLGRELTKQFEEVHTLPARTLPGWLAANPHRLKGEYVIMVHATRAQSGDSSQGQAAMRILMAELPLGQAARLAAQISSGSRKDLYQWGLEQKGEHEQGHLADQDDA